MGTEASRCREWHCPCLEKGMKIFLSLILAAGLARCVAASETSLEVLEEINLARTCPKQYGELLAQRMGGAASEQTRKSVAETVTFLNHTKPLPPLDFSDGLMLGAQSHVADQGARGTTGHLGTDRSRPWDRMAKFAQWSGGAGENISYGYAEAKNIVATLIIDQGVAGHGHRKNIFSSNFSVAGIACGKHARFGSMCVIDFAGGAARPGQTELASTATGSLRGWSSFDALRAH